jgi:hypothetical protein
MIVLIDILSERVANMSAPIRNERVVRTRSPIDIQRFLGREGRVFGIDGYGDEQW